MGIKTRPDPRRRIAAQAHGNWKHTQWQQADIVGDIGVVFSKIFHQMGTHQYPPMFNRIRGLMFDRIYSQRFFTRWGLMFNRIWRVTDLIFGIPFASAKWDSTAGNWCIRGPVLGYVLVPRGKKVDRSRRRRLRARTSPLSGTMGLFTLEDRSVLRVPADDEMVPAEQRVVLLLSPPPRHSIWRPLSLNREGPMAMM